MNRQYPTHQPHPDPIVEALINLPGMDWWHEGEYHYHGQIGEMVRAIEQAIAPVEPT